MSPAAAAPAPMSLPAPRIAAPMLMVSVTMPRDWAREREEAVLRRAARLRRRLEGGWKREREVDGPVGEGMLGGRALVGEGVDDGPFVKARRAMGWAWRRAEAPLRRVERTASWAMEFMIDDG